MAMPATHFRAWIGAAALCALLPFSSALAAGSAAPAPKDKLAEARAALEASQARITTLKQDSAGLEGELTRLREKMVDVADALQQREARLLELEKRMAKLETRRKDAEQDLSHRSKEIGMLLQSLIRLSRTPPEAVVAMPGELRHTLQAADLLRHITADIQHKTSALQQVLVQLKTDRSHLESTQAALRTETAQMQLAKKALDTQVVNRQQLQHQLNRQQEEESARLAVLSRDANSLQELMEKIEAEEKAKAVRKVNVLANIRPKPKPAALLAASRPVAQPTPTTTATPAEQPVPEPLETAALPEPTPATTPPARHVPAPTPAPESTSPRKPVTSSREFAAARGRLRWPVAGNVVQHYGEKIHQNETHRGLTLAGRQQAQVVAPFAGEVVFTGPFLDYGQMVILRYGKDYLLLLAGLSRVDCTMGQHLSAGEPLGQLGNTGFRPANGRVKLPQGRALLYLELRHHRKPIDPGAWFG